MNKWKALRDVTFTEDEIEQMDKLVYGEARGEPFEGQVAVAAVVLNRVANSELLQSPNGNVGLDLDTITNQVYR